MGHFVSKKEGCVRLVTDIHSINRKIRHPVKPFKSSDQIQKYLKPRAKVYTTLYLVSKYQQVKLVEEFPDLTWFILPCEGTAAQSFLLGWSPVLVIQLRNLGKT